MPSGPRHMTSAPEVALLMRERQRPLECERKRGCWVNTGSRVDEFHRQYAAWCRKAAAR